MFPRALRLLAFGVFAVILAGHGWFAWRELVPGRGLPNASEGLLLIAVLALLFAWGITAAWGGFLRRSRAALAAGVVLLALYTWFTASFVLGLASAAGSWAAAYFAALWAVAIAGMLSALVPGAPPDLRVRGWSPAGAFAALFLTFVALLHIGVVADLAGGFRWMTGAYAAGVGALAILAVAMAGLAWAGLAFRGGRARVALLAVFAAYSGSVAVLAWLWDERLDQPPPELWPILVSLGVVWTVTGVGAVGSARRRAA